MKQAISINPRALGTNSLNNALMVASAQPKPEAGMGATIVLYTDTYAATIVDVSANLREVTIREDVATRTDKNGPSESQDYTFTRSYTAKPQVFTLRKTGRYVRQGERSNGGTHLVIGTREQYIDPSF